MLIRPKQTPPTYRQVKSSDIPIKNEQTNGDYLNLFKKWVHHFVEPFNVLINKPMFIAIITARVFTNIAFNGWAIFLVPHAIEKGLSASKAALLASVGGIAAIFGRLSPGPIVDSGFMSATKLSVLTLVTNTAAYVFDYWAYSFWSLSLAALINGFNFGSDVVLIFPLCVEVLGERDAIDGYGLCLIPASIGGLVGGLLIGKYYAFSQIKTLQFIYIGNLQGSVLKTKTNMK